MNSSGRVGSLLERLRKPREIRWEPDGELLTIAAALQKKASAREGLLKDALAVVSNAAAADHEVLLAHVRTGGATAAMEMLHPPSRDSPGAAPSEAHRFGQELSLLATDISHLRSRLRSVLPHVFEEHGARGVDGAEVAVLDSALGLLQLHLAERTASLDLAALAFDYAEPVPSSVDETIKFLYEAELSDSQIAKVVARHHPSLVEQTRARFFEKEGPLDETGKPWTEEVLEKLVAKRVADNVTRRRKDLGLKKDAEGRPISHDE